MQHTSIIGKEIIRTSQTYCGVETILDILLHKIHTENSALIRKQALPVLPSLLNLGERGLSGTITKKTAPLVST
jgi:hypothetical protein